MTQLTDEALIQLYFARSEEAVSATREVYGPYCRAIALGIWGDEGDAEECLSDVWLRAWDSVPPLRPTCFKGWLAAVTRNQAVSLLRARARPYRRLPVRGPAGDGGGGAVLWGEC